VELAITSTPTETPLPCTLLFSGRVTDSISGAAIDGAALCLNSGFCVQTDPTGVYAGLCYPGQSSAGTQLCAEAAGYKTACQGPWTPTGGSLEVNFLLEPVATPTPTTPIVDHPTPTPTPTFTPTSCVSDPPLVYPVTSPTDQLMQTITGYSPGLLCPRGGSIEIFGVEVLTQTQHCAQGTFEATVELQPDQTNSFMVCLRPGLCGNGGCTAVEIVQTSSQPTPTDTATATPTPTPTPCPACMLLGHLSVSQPTVEPPNPVVGDQVTFTFQVSYALPGGFNCESCTFEGGEDYLAGDDPPVQSGDTVVVQRRVVRAGNATIQLRVRETTEVQCYAPDPLEGCRMYFQFAFIEASSAPFSLLLAEVGPCAGDCDEDGAATIAEVVTMVNIALGNAELSACRFGDRSGDEEITVDEIIVAVHHALTGCPAPEPSFMVSGRVAEFPGCVGYMRGVSVVLNPLGLTTETQIGPDPGVAGTFFVENVPPGEYTLTIPLGCNPYGCWPPTPVKVVDHDVDVQICNVAM